MKKISIIIIVLSFLVLPNICVALPCSNPASTVNIDAFAQFLKPTKVQEALTNYASYPGDGQHELCFQMSSPLSISSASSVKAFILNLSGSDNVYITGLKLVRHDDLSGDTPLFSVGNSGSGKAIVAGISLSNVHNGLTLSGVGAIELSSYNDNKTVITGSSTKSGACIDVKSPGAVLSGVQASSCHEGVKVDANGVIIKDKSAIASNHLGVRVLSGRAGTDVKSSLVYANNDGDDSNLWRNDGIRIDDGAMNEVVFYDVVNNEPTPLLDETDVVQYGGRPAYMLLDIPENKKGRIEFYLSNRDDCGLAAGIDAYGQNCALVEGMTNPIEIEATTLAQAPVQVTIPPQYLSKHIVTVFSDDERGTAGISKQFSLSESGGGVVAFVANPYDIPTSGGAVETGSTSSDDEEEQTTGGSSMDGVNTAGEGSSLIDAAGGPSGCGGGASIMALSWRDSSIAGVLWFLIVISAAIASLRLVRVRFKHGQR